MLSDIPEYVRGMITGGFLVMFLYNLVICKLKGK